MRVGRIPMIDNFTLLTVTSIIVFLVYRAAQLDRTQPWFGSGPTPGKLPEWRKSAARPEPGWRQRAAPASRRSRRTAPPGRSRGPASG